MKSTLPALGFCLAALPALAGGFECEMKRECEGANCDEINQRAYIDTDWGQIVLKGYGPEIAFDHIPIEGDSDTWRLFAQLPAAGLFIIVINEDSSAVFTTFGKQGGLARVISVFGTCEARG